MARPSKQVRVQILRRRIIRFAKSFDHQNSVATHLNSLSRGETIVLHSRADGELRLAEVLLNLKEDLGIKLIPSRNPDNIFFKLDVEDLLAY